MKREVASRLLVGLLVVGVFLAVYNFSLGPTGFAVFEQNNCGSFDEGVYENTLCDINTNLVSLDGNQTSGRYISKVFDASESLSWDSLSWEGSETLTFEVRNCSTSDCSDGTFSSADLEEIGLTGQYFQYEATFDSSTINGTNETLSLESVSVDSSPIPIPVETSVSVSEPQGTKTSASDIPLNFNVIGDDLSCGYNIRNNSGSVIVTENTTISGCSNTTFSLNVGNGEFVLNLYANGSSGFDSQDSTFSIDVPVVEEEPVEETEEEEETEEPVESTIQVPVVPVAPTEEAPKVTEITISDVLTFTSVPGRSQEVKLTVRNSGTEPVSACVLKAQGDIASLLAIPKSFLILKAGESP